MTGDFDVITVRLPLDAAEIAMLDELVAASNLGSRTALVLSLVRAIIADEMGDQAAEEKAA